MGDDVEMYICDPDGTDAEDTFHQTTGDLCAIVELSQLIYIYE